MKDAIELDFLLGKEGVGLDDIRDPLLQDWDSRKVEKEATPHHRALDCQRQQPLKGARSPHL